MDHTDYQFMLIFKKIVHILEMNNKFLNSIESELIETNDLLKKLVEGDGHVKTEENNR